MIDHEIAARFEEFDLPTANTDNVAAVIPTVRGTTFSRYGIHAYYFLNFRTSKGFCVTIKHKDIIAPGLRQFWEATDMHGRCFPRLRSLFQNYHYGFSFPEQIMYMTVPHTTTEVGDARFMINLWSYFGYLLVDCKKKTVTYRMADWNESHVLGAQQWCDPDSGDRYYMTYSLKDSLRKAVNPNQNVFSRIMKDGNGTGQPKVLWQGQFSDYMHDIHVNETKQYCVTCELGMFSDSSGNVIPSKVLVLDLKNGKEWLLSRFIVAAHAQFDPEDPNVIYFSNHNFQFQHTSILRLLRQGGYSIKFRGPASVYKYRLTPDGPQEIGVFTDPGLLRLTNFQVFRHRGRKVIAAMGAPNFIFLADAEDMKLLKRIEVKEPNAKKPPLIGTFSASPSGDKLYVQTTKSFQLVDLSDGTSEVLLSHRSNHTCSNHMAISNDTSW